MRENPKLTNLRKDYGFPKSQQHTQLQELTRPHVDSFNYMLRDGLHEAVQNIQPLEFELPNGDRASFYYMDARIGCPLVAQGNQHARVLKVYPTECRERGITYRAKMQVTIGWSVNGKYQGQMERVIGEVPIMVKSSACNISNLCPAELIKHGEEQQEMGGYFIINGIERIIRMLIMPRRNYPTAITRPSWKDRGKQYTEYGVTMRCVSLDQTTANMVLHYLNNGTANLCLTYRKEQFFLPVMMVLKALVDVPDQIIYSQLIQGNENNAFFKGCMANMLRQIQAAKLHKRKDILKFMGERFRIKVQLPAWYTDFQVGEYLLDKCVCIHLDSNAEKSSVLIYMIKKLFAFAKGECAAESADNPMNQEILLGGHLYLMLLKEKMEGSLYSLKVSFDRKMNSKTTDFSLDQATIHDACRHMYEITKPMEYLLATGNLVSKTGLGLMQASGLTVVADKLNFYRYLSHFRCVHRGSFFAQMRTTAVRKLLPEAWGFLCPVHTPDGAPCGLLNHLSALCEVVTDDPPVASLSKLLCTMGMSPHDGAPPGEGADYYTVLLDGKVLGWVHASQAQNIADNLRIMKVKGLNKVPQMLEICLVPKSKVASQYPGLYLFSLSARMMRPVQNLALKETEMIGTFEQVYLNICITDKEKYEGLTSHQELCENSMLSSIASLTPFSDFNQSPRNMYQCQMGKQTMGTPLHALGHRSDNKLYRNQTPQVPLVRPHRHDHYNIDDYPTGTNAVVAVISYTGYDMEDAMILNKSSFERGFAHGSVYKSEFVDLRKISQDRHRMTLKFGTRLNDPKMVGRLETDGLPAVGTYLQEGDPYYSYMNIQTGEVHTVKYKSQEPAYVEQIKLCGNDLGNEELQKICIVLRLQRNPIIGDKFASRHGQKGICSQKWPVENMPFTESGMTPDIIFNPHGYPSRMTIGMMIETMAGKAASMHGHVYDATPFTFSEENSAVDYFGRTLTAAGYNYYGTERMYSGIDGREMEADIFIGVVYYQRLRHMVSDKFQVRTTGPVDILTHQPVQGRKRMGGIRFGEMERDGLLSHGTSYLLQDRLLNCSDKCVTHVCTKCGSILSPLMQRPSSATEAVSFEAGRRWMCAQCEQSDTVKLLTVPYVFRYVVAELAAMNIKVTLDIGSKIN